MSILAACSQTHTLRLPNMRKVLTLRNSPKTGSTHSCLRIWAVSRVKEHSNWISRKFLTKDSNEKLRLTSTQVLVTTTKRLVSLKNRSIIFKVLVLAMAVSPLVKSMIRLCSLILSLQSSLLILHHPPLRILILSRDRISNNSYLISRKATSHNLFETMSQVESRTMQPSVPSTSPTKAMRIKAPMRTKRKITVNFLAHSKSEILMFFLLITSRTACGQIHPKWTINKAAVGRIEIECQTISRSSSSLKWLSLVAKVKGDNLAGVTTSKLLWLL